MAYANIERRREYHREWSRKWRADNSEEYKARRRQVHAGDPEKRNARRRKHYADNIEVMRAARREEHYKTTYGLTIAERDAMILQQGGKCAACQTSDPGGKNGWHDHCHTRRIVRGILCHGCNLALGNVKDDPVRLVALIHYLERTEA